MRNEGHPDSWYRVSVPDPPRFPALQGDVRVDVGIVGGGYTGLGAALELAQKGVRVALLEGADIGSGASGRNGGQVHTGQRNDPEKLLEAWLGEDAARQLWDMAEDAKVNLHEITTVHDIDCDYRPGLIHAWHRPRFAAEDAAYADFIHRRYGYDKLRLLSRDETATELGTDVYHGGIFDGGAGHLHPLKWALGLARAAAQAGARLYENSRVTGIDLSGPNPVLKTAGGRVTCDSVLLCGNGYMEGLDERVDAHVLPINNFILTTEPLADTAILPNGHAAADSRFVVHYWRKTPDNRLLFGGGENYTPWFPKDIKAFVRAHMLKIYPQLRNVEISHAWGGTLAITMTRAPFVRRLSKNVFVSAGYSGQGVVLAPYFGRLLARAVLGDDRDVELLSRLPVPPFFGGRLLRWPALVAGLSYYALRDRL